MILKERRGVTLSPVAGLFSSRGRSMPQFGDAYTTKAVGKSMVVEKPQMFHSLSSLDSLAKSGRPSRTF